ncbi:zinc-dependent peptidase [Thiohalospira sp.]|uniref:M90 family metallopeptidase n=1 Tax=Thiohalospira sp. TaxID=3080549 RepID=UPI00397ECB7F
MLQRLRAWHRQRLLRRHGIAPGPWSAALRAFPLAGELSSGEQRQLWEVASLFLHRKAVEGGGGLEVTPEMAISVAIQAALPLLHLDPHYLDGWHAVIIHPGTFVARHEEVDEAGVEHITERELAGEAWDRGPLVLAWEDARPDHPGADEGNVVIHEIAHKIDASNGVANGFPPLRRGMDPQAWTAAFEAAWAHLEAADEAGHPDLDPYALTDPAEFFAVACEYFFVLPDQLETAYPALYDQLREFFAQDPLSRRVLGHHPGHRGDQRR